MLNGTTGSPLGVCETQPATAEGIRALLVGVGGLECRWTVHSLSMGMHLVRQEPVRVVLLDKGFGLQSVLQALQELRQAGDEVAPVVWGVSMSEPEALRLLQSGARGILRKTADAATIVSCLRTVSEGGAWLEECVFREATRLERGQRSELTAREQQVLELVEQGMRNKDIAEELGIRPGTVKIHLKHIFEKTGVHGRYGLALNGMRRRGLLSELQPVEAEAACRV